MLRCRDGRHDTGSTLNLAALIARRQTGEGVEVHGVSPLAEVVYFNELGDAGEVQVPNGRSQGKEERSTRR